MIIAKNDEAKRSKIWRIVTSVSSVLIIIIAIFLLTKLFTTNPLEGDWASDDGNLNMSIKSNGKMSVTISEVADVSDVTVNMNYTMDKEEKTIIITADESELKDMAEKSDGQLQPAADVSQFLPFSPPPSQQRRQPWKQIAVHGNR